MNLIIHHYCLNMILHRILNLKYSKSTHQDTGSVVHFVSDCWCTAGASGPWPRGWRRGTRPGGRGCPAPGPAWTARTASATARGTSRGSCSPPRRWLSGRGSAASRFCKEQINYQIPDIYIRTSRKA